MTLLEMSPAVPPHHPPRDCRERDRPSSLSLILSIAFALRLSVWVILPNTHWNDEIFQVSEPAHRLVFGTGIVSWEWLLGIRSWLLPGVLAGLMTIGRLLGETDPTLINLPGAVMMAALGCLPVFCGYRWGQNLYGAAGGMITGVATCVWSDMIYMSPHTLGEVVAGDLLPLALYLGQPYTRDGHPRLRRLVWAGAALGAIFAVRFHLAPALLVAAIGIGRGRGEDWRALTIGALVPILAFGVLDWVTLGLPFQSVWLNIWYNLFEGVSREFGTDPWWMLLATVAIIWLPALPPLVLAVCFGARRAPLLGLVALTVFVTHAGIPHKEYRFIYPAIPLLIILAGLGTAGIADALGRRLPGRSAISVAAAGAVLLWLGMSSLIATRPFMNPAWTREAGYFRAFAEINRLPQICAVATNHSIASPGNTWLRPGLPLYQINLVDITPARFARAADAFNAIAASSLVRITDPRFRRLGCHDGNIDAHGVVHLRICVWVRDGGCDVRAAPPPEPYWPDYFRRRLAMPPFDWAPLFTEAGP